MANSVDPDQTAQSVLGLCCLFYTYFVSNARQLFAADDFSRRHFQMHFFLGALRVKRLFWPPITIAFYLFLISLLQQ